MGPSMPSNESTEESTHTTLNGRVVGKPDGMAAANAQTITSTRCAKTISTVGDADRDSWDARRSNRLRGSPTD